MWQGYWISSKLMGEGGMLGPRGDKGIFWGVGSAEAAFLI